MEDQSTSLQSSMTSALIGRVLTTLLTSKPKKLESAIADLSNTSHSTSGSMAESLRYLRKYVKAAVDEMEPLDDVLVPMIENSLQPRNSKHVNQAMILLNWLFQDEALPLAKGLSLIISRREDHYIALGWCKLVRSLVEYDTKMAQFLKNGIRDNFQSLLNILSSSIVHLSRIVRDRSVLQDGFELPTRLSIAAADCILVLTKALTNKSSDSEVSSDNVSSRPSASNTPVNFLEEKQVTQKNVPSALLLWHQLDQLITLVQKLGSWSQKSRPLHAKGLDRVFKWLQEMQKNYSTVPHEAGPQFKTTGALLLSSCWRHYSMLSLLEDSSFTQSIDALVEQYLSGLQLYTEGNVKNHTENKESCIETRKFFLNCLTLLLGRLDTERLEATTSVYGARMSNVLLSQLHCADEVVIDGAICILRSAIFKITGSSIDIPGETEMLFPNLLNLLGQCDAAARAVIVLIAEYCSKSTNSWCLKEVLNLLSSGDVPKRRNALDIISELVRISSNSMEVAPGSIWQDMTNQIVDCLGDEDVSIRVKAISLLPFTDLSLALPRLVRSICSEDGTVSSAFSSALVEVLSHHSQSFDVINIMLDSLSNLCEASNQQQGLGVTTKGTSKFEPDGVFRLIPEWSKTIQDWNFLVGPLIEKMLSEPSNATMIRFLSCINEHIADVADDILYKLLSRAQEQEECSTSIHAVGESKANECINSDKMKTTVFDRLCPLLILKMLPLRIFDDLNRTIMCSQTLNHYATHGSKPLNFCKFECVSTLLFNRAFGHSEYDDVRKVAAELCGRIHPQVLFPVVLSEFQRAVDTKDVLNMKACLFAMCTSLAIRGWDSASHLDVCRIVRILHAVLLWPSMDGDEVSKAQHGCIDCLAFLICAELQAPKQIGDSMLKKSQVITQNASVTLSTRTSLIGFSVLSAVIDYLAGNSVQIGLSCELFENAQRMASVPIPFRLCMANVLISTCQKISESCKKTFVKKTVPRLIHLAQITTDFAIRAACIQVLFSSAFHLKPQVAPHARDLFKVSLDSLRKESEQEKMAGAKLMACLMASEEEVIESISGGLLEARSVLATLSTCDPSPQLRQICHKLLLCLTSR